MKNKELTKRQESVLGFIEEYLTEHGYPPSVREICAALSISGPAGVLKHLKALERKGRIRRVPGASRAIELTKTPPRLSPHTQNTVALPIVGEVRAGGPELAVEDVSGYATLDSSIFGLSAGREGAFILRALGESMTGAGIDDGDHLLVVPCPEPSNGDIVVAVVEGEATVKRFSADERGVTLSPENPSMEQILVTGGELSIKGRVASVIKNMERRVRKGP